MVLICNNKIISIEQFHKNRCIEKNEIINILIQMNSNKDEFEQIPYTTREFNRSISEKRENTRVFSIKDKNYDCRKVKRQYKH